MKNYEIKFINEHIDEKCISDCPDMDVRRFLQWWNDQNYSFPICFTICFDLDFIAKVYDNKGWNELDFVYDKQLNVAFLWCPHHDGLLYALYCYHNNLDVDENWQHHPEIIEKYMDKYGILKSSVSSSLFCGESFIFPPKLMHLNYLSDDLNEYLYVRD